MMQKIQKLFLNPLALAPASFILFAIGFTMGLWKVGFWRPIYSAQEPVDKSSVEERVRAELEKLRKVALELDLRGSDLKKRAEALDEHEASIRKSESNLKLERTSLEKVNESIASLQKQLDAKLILLDAAQESSIQQLSKLYSSMDPQSAAKVLKTLPESQVVQIVRKMKEANSAKILNIWAGGDEISTQKAARITTMMRAAIQPPSE